MLSGWGCRTTCLSSQHRPYKALCCRPSKSHLSFSAGPPLCSQAHLQLLVYFLSSNMKTLTILGAVSALFLSSAKAQITVVRAMPEHSSMFVHSLTDLQTIPPFPDLPTMSIPTLTLPTSISLPSLPSVAIPTLPTSLPESVCFAIPSIPTSISVPTLMAAAPTAGPDSNTTQVPNDQFERMHPRQIAPLGA